MAKKIRVYFYPDLDISQPSGDYIYKLEPVATKNRMVWMANSLACFNWLKAQFDKAEGTYKDLLRLMIEQAILIKSTVKYIESESGVEA